MQYNLSDSIFGHCELRCNKNVDSCRLQQVPRWRSRQRVSLIISAIRSEQSECREFDPHTGHDFLQFFFRFRSLLQYMRGKRFSYNLFNLLVDLTCNQGYVRTLFNGRLNFCSDLQPDFQDKSSKRLIMLENLQDLREHNVIVCYVFTGWSTARTSGMTLTRASTSRCSTVTSSAGSGSSSKISLAPTFRLARAKLSGLTCMLYKLLT